jgi:predicted transcriptional regulator
MTEADQGGLRARSEEALGDLAQALLENPLFNSAIGRALGAGERAVQAQRSAMAAAGVATNDEVERLERRVRALSARLEELEDRLDEVVDELAAVRKDARESVSGDQGSLGVE